MSFFFGGDPMGGMGGMGGRSREPANTTEYYETLGVSKDATKGAIKKAYFKLCKTHHPDKGGDAEQVRLRLLVASAAPSHCRTCELAFACGGLRRLPPALFSHMGCGVGINSSRRSRRPMRPCMTRRSVRSTTRYLRSRLLVAQLGVFPDRASRNCSTERRD